MQLVLRLDDDVDPPAGRMKLDVTAAKLTAAIRCYGLLIRELTIGVVEYLEATEILFPLPGNPLIAARRRLSFPISKTRNSR